MKILGEKSLSSKVKVGLEVLFVIIALWDMVIFAIIGNIVLSETKDIVFKNYLSEIILITIISVVLCLTGLVALYIIYQFIKIFKNLKQNKLFENENTKHLNKIALFSIIISVLYLIILIGISITLNKSLQFSQLDAILIKVIIGVFFMGFLVFGIGIKILNEIYKKAIEYKEENELTV